MQELLRSNAADNAEAIGRAGGCVDVTELTWGQPELPHGWNAPDFVLAADLVYNRHLYEPLLKTLQQFGALCRSCLPSDDDTMSMFDQWRLMRNPPDGRTFGGSDILALSCACRKQHDDTGGECAALEARRIPVLQAGKEGVLACRPHAIHSAGQIGAAQHAVQQPAAAVSVQKELCDTIIKNPRNSFFM